MVVNRTGFFLVSSARIIGVMGGGFNLLATAIWINIDAVRGMFMAEFSRDLAKNPRSPASCGLVIPGHYILWLLVGVPRQLSLRYQRIGGEALRGRGVPTEQGLTPNPRLPKANHFAKSLRVT